MSQVKIMTDSVAGIPREMIEEYGIEVVPAANISVNGRTYVEGVDLSVAGAYELIEKDPDRFVTSALNPGQLLEKYRGLAKNHKEIVFITISSALTALNSTAQFAADALREETEDVKVTVVDTKTAAGAQGLAVLAAARAAKKGLGTDTIVEIVHKVRQNTGYIVYLDTLRYVYRTGRMSKLASRMASIFNVRPISKISESGTLDFVSRVKTRVQGMAKMLELIESEKGRVPMHFWVMHADAPEFAAEFCAKIKDRFEVLSLTVSEYSSVMGYGTGRGALSVGYHPELNLAE
jgi:DegV family protein with EDD domain